MQLHHNAQDDEGEFIDYEEVKNNSPDQDSQPYRPTTLHQTIGDWVIAKNNQFIAFN
ncbi:MAG: hypothetical protein IPN76_33790 [Saprospiraceae bacterium]|nr:hypothetical protein [Saprospiraceae bacterium]